MVSETSLGVTSTAHKGHWHGNTQELVTGKNDILHITDELMHSRNSSDYYLPF